MRSRFVLIITCAITLLFYSCAAKRVVVPEIHERIIHQRDTVYRTDSVVSNNTTIIQQADSAMMASYGIRISKIEKAWLVKQNQDTHSNSAVRFIMRKDSIVHDTIPTVRSKECLCRKEVAMVQKCADNSWRMGGVYTDSLSVWYFNR